MSSKWFCCWFVADFLSSSPSWGLLRMSLWDSWILRPFTPVKPVLGSTTVAWSQESTSSSLLAVASSLHTYPLAHCMSLLSAGANPEIAWPWQQVPHDILHPRHLTCPTPVLALPLKLLKSNSSKIWTWCHSQIPSEPTFLRAFWEWSSQGRKDYRAEDGYLEASRDNVPFLTWHSGCKASIYLLWSRKISLQNEEVVGLWDHWRFGTMGVGSQGWLLGL